MTVKIAVRLTVEVDPTGELGFRDKHPFVGFLYNSPGELGPVTIKLGDTVKDVLTQFAHEMV